MKPQKLALILLAVITLVCFAACNNPWWPHRGDVTVDFDPNGGMGTPPPAQSVTDGESITVPTSNGLTRAGFYFDGWNTKADYSGKDYYVGQSYKTAGSATLFARWITADSPYYYYPYYPAVSNDGANTVTPRGKGGNASAGLKVTYHAQIPGAGVRPNIAARAATVPGPGVVIGDLPVDPKSGKYAPGETVEVMDGRHLIRDKYVFAEWVNDPGYIDNGEWLIYRDTFSIKDHTDLYALWLEEDKVIKNETYKTFNFPPKEYGYDAASLTKGMTVLNTGGAATSSLTVVFEWPGKEDGEDCPFVITLPDPIQGIAQGGREDFNITPKGGLGVGSYSVIVRIYDDADYDKASFYACFIAGFTVLPADLAVAVTNFSYNNYSGAGAGGINGESYLTPIFSAANGGYTERKATFDVTVSGFKAAADADNVTLAFPDPAGTGITFAAAKGTFSVDTQHFSITAAYNGTAAFPSGSATFAIALNDTPANYDSYSSGSVDIYVRDGITDAPRRVIPVTKANNEAASGLTPFNAYMTNSADSTWPHALTLNYKQTEHIVLDDTAANNWAAIGTDANRFTGSYDGGNNTITGLTISINAINQGMFGYIGAGGVVENLGLVNVNVIITGMTGTNDYGVGGLAGRNYGTVQNCYVTGTINSSARGTGGLVGMNYATGTISNCYFKGNVRGLQDTGGLVGQNKSTIQNCYTTGEVRGGGSLYVGGIVGCNVVDGKTAILIENCYSTSTLTSSSTNIGGLVGGNNTTGTLQNSVALNPSVLRLSNVVTTVGRVDGQGNLTLINNYARSDMEVGYGNASGDLITAKSPLAATTNGKDGKDIGPAEWESADWWKNTAAAAGEGPGFGSVWYFDDLDSTSLPKLLNMPKGPNDEDGLYIQEPVIQ